ncbi:hypothetical protein [Metabacillus malikii]|uniref:Competence protein ComGC n=1 Tax=Metabacillus malikii TaxID=1504265 RepID=A0ABT9ZL58_9BACI|nr:hypothetical protein [Metabacillus malikii]MDQ0232624.1 competence protein ComGC [Metabacillus malikii]
MGLMNPAGMIIVLVVISLIGILIYKIVKSMKKSDDDSKDVKLKELETRVDKLEKNN